MGKGVMRQQTVFVELRKIPTWKLVLGAALGSVVLVGMLSLAFAAFLIVAPIAAIAGAVAGWFGLRKVRQATQAGTQARRPDVVDAEYTVIETRVPPRDRVPPQT